MKAMGRERMSNAAVKAKTGKDWQQWFSILDKSGANKMSHKEIAEYLNQKRGVSGWWSQMVTVTYEQERGLRKKYERPDGYSVSISKTLEVPIGILYNSWTNEKLCSKWLEEKFTVRKAAVNKSMRITWNDGTNVDVEFYSKDPNKSQVVVQHSELAGSDHVERIRSYWKAALGRLSLEL